MSINSVNISGNLTGNFELRATPAGAPVLEFCVVVSDRRRNSQNGEWIDHPNYINCVMFGTRAESLSKIFEKGMKVAVSGHLRQESWERDGQKRTAISVVADNVDIMVRSNGSRASEQPAQVTYTAQPQNVQQNVSGGFSAVNYDYADEEFPF